MLGIMTSGQLGHSFENIPTRQVLAHLPLSAPHWAPSTGLTEFKSLLFCQDQANYRNFTVQCKDSASCIQLGGSTCVGDIARVPFPRHFHAAIRV